MNTNEIGGERFSYTPPTNQSQQPALSGTDLKTQQISLGLIKITNLEIKYQRRCDFLVERFIEERIESGIEWDYGRWVTERVDIEKLEELLINPEEYCTNNSTPSKEVSPPSIEEVD